MSFPRYSAYKESKNDWVAHVPEHWELMPCRGFVDERTEKNEDAACQSYLSLMANVGIIPYEEKGDIGNKKPEDLSKCKIVYQGDFVINSMNYGIGSYGVSAYEGVCSAVYIVLTPRQVVVEPRFAFRIFEDKRFQAYAQSLGNGILAHRCAIGWDDLKGIVVGIPSAAEQKSILNFLDRETAKIDALISEQKHLIELLQEKRQAVISHAVTKGLNPDAPMKDSGVEWLGEVPENWDIAAVGHRYSVQLGKMLDANQQTGNHSKPYLRVADVQWREINTEDLPEMDFPPEAEDRYRLRAGDLLVNEGGSYVGRSAIWRAPIEECYYQKALHRLRAYDETKDSPHFMYCLMEHATRLGVFIAGGNQTTIDHLTAEQLRRYRFGFPPMQEQEQIAIYLRLKTESLQQLTIQAESMVGVLLERRSALISAAVTGQIDVRGLVEAEVGEQ